MLSRHHVVKMLQVHSPVCRVQGVEAVQDMHLEMGRRPAQQRDPLAELAQAEGLEDSTAAASGDGGVAQQAAEADEPVSDTDNEDEGERCRRQGHMHIWELLHRFTAAHVYPVHPAGLLPLTFSFCLCPQ